MSGGLGVKIAEDAPVAPRVGARRPDLVPAEVRELLESGGSSVNHMEQMAFDMGALLRNAFPELDGEAERLREGGLVRKMRVGGEVLFEAYGLDAWARASGHRSDTVRGWAAMAVGHSALSLADLLAAMRPFADDSHFAVREWAWLAVRSRAITETQQAVELLCDWTAADSPRIRRFASETTRPRGVWSAHIPILKQQPELAEGMLFALRADPSRYVQDSVGNWLNDASKSQPEWVERTCGSWLSEGEDEATRRICRRGMRTLTKRERAGSASKLAEK